MCVGKEILSELSASEILRDKSSTYCLLHRNQTLRTQDISD